MGRHQYPGPTLDPADFQSQDAWPKLRLLMVSTTGEHHAYFELDESLRPVEKDLPDSLSESVARIKENCEPALSTVLFMGGAGGSLRAGVTENPVRLTHSVRDALTRVTCGGAPVYVWPGGGITFMVDVTRMPENAFGYVPTPALVAPIEFTLKIRDYAALGGYMEHVRPLEFVMDIEGRRHVPAHPENPWPLAQPKATKSKPGSNESRFDEQGRINEVRSMKPRAQITFLPDRRRLHLHDGPIDVIVEAFGSRAEVDSAYRAAARRFVTVLDELCTELSLLRQPVQNDTRPIGIVARRMFHAVAPYCEQIFITPMAAVAGAVAEEILGAMTSAAKLSRAYVNNGGDIALHLAPGEQFLAGMVERLDRPSLFGSAMLHSSEPVRGIATSGWRGRSFSLGIADAVTVLADRAAMADAAATIIANAVDLPGHPNIIRAPACELAPDSDLDDRLVTQGVGELSAEEISKALDAGVCAANALLTRGLVRSAALHLCGYTRIVDTTPAMSS